MSNGDWVQFRFRVPDGDFQKVYEFARSLGFVEIDFAEMRRAEDHARADYAPCVSHSSSGYTIDPFDRSE